MYFSLFFCSLIQQGRLCSIVKKAMANTFLLTHFFITINTHGISFESAQGHRQDQNERI